MDNLRPWRKRTLQIITTERLRKGSMDTVDGEQLAQVGGNGSVDKSQAMQVNREGLVLKPIQEGARGEREVEFFKTVTNSSDPTEAVWQEFIPQFYGVSRKILEDGTKVEYLMMENLTKDFSKPCIMDVKIGAKTYGPDASEKKKATQDASYAGTKQPFGFSVPGMSVHVGEEKEKVIMKGKEYGRTLNVDNIHELLEMYLDMNNEPEVAKELAQLFVEDLKKVLQLFQYQTTFHFFASSLLFVYDAEAAKNFKETKDASLRKFTSLKMIDFAHVWKAEGKIDQNYMKGVQSLIDLFQNV
jgi:1D-myo-inositol-tetrakisphosphate 5-kinase/inositol-polyphosphate multikinase